MTRVIVTTTIHAPSKALLAFAQIARSQGWTFVIVGDQKTPHALFERLCRENPHVIYLRPEDQAREFPEISRLLGWNTIERRNIGFLMAFRLGAEIIATVDDDNVPYPGWGEGLLVNQTVSVPCYQPENGIVFDPFSITAHNGLWHRGYPIQLLEQKNLVELVGTRSRKVLVQADLCDGDPDIDAICRIAMRPSVKFDVQGPCAATTLAPFDSQNTFFSREVLPYYAMLPFIGRMDDIWASYILQAYFPDSVIFNTASVCQERNQQDLVVNLEAEMIGYRQTLPLVQEIAGRRKSIDDILRDFLPEKCAEFYFAYRRQFTDRPASFSGVLEEPCASPL